MSKHNKVNPGQYHIAGRLTPDEAARERVKQRTTPAAATKAPQADTARNVPKAPNARGVAGAERQTGSPEPAKPKARSASRSRG